MELVFIIKEFMCTQVYIYIYISDIYKNKYMLCVIYTNTPTYIIPYTIPYTIYIIHTDINKVPLTHKLPIQALGGKESMLI